MPKPPLPRELTDFLAQPNPAVIATLDADGSPHTAATWYLWEDGGAVVNMAESRKRLQHMREDPRVSLTVMGSGDAWYHHVTLRGRVSGLEDDAGLVHIDRLSRHYMGNDYGARDQGRVTAWIDVEWWHAWDMGQPWTPVD
jgi:PPOX class probable F420-dependent enzyme